MHGHDHKHSDGDFVDPHAWLNVRNVIVYVQNIAAALQVAARMRVTQRAISRTVAATGCDHQDADGGYSDWDLLLSAHASTAILRTRITSVSHRWASILKCPSARAMAKVIDHIHDNNVRFFEKINDPRLLERIVVETHINIGGHHIQTRCLLHPEKRPLTSL